MNDDINVKSIAFLIDSLITADLRCWFAQEQIMNESLSEGKRLEAAIRAQEQNAIRSKIMKAIDDRLGDGAISVGGTKTYYTYFDDDAITYSGGPIKKEPEVTPSD